MTVFSLIFLIFLLLYFSFTALFAVALFYIGFVAIGLPLVFALDFAEDRGSFAGSFGNNIVIHSSWEGA